MAARAVVDLHCHTSASFDSLSDPVAVARTAASRGITHLAITDHDRIDGALRARDAATPGLTVIVGLRACAACRQRLPATKSLIDGKSRRGKYGSTSRAIR